MADTNVGMGMVPHKKGCRCFECELERLQRENDELRADAERYRAWAKSPYTLFNIAWKLWDGDTDWSIPFDAARKEQK